MTTITIDEAQSHLGELIESLNDGDVVVILRDNQRVARLIAEKPSSGQRIPGSAKGKLVIHSEDDEHLKDFEECMP